MSEKSLTFGSRSPFTKDKPVSESSGSLYFTDWCGGEQVKNTAKTKSSHGKIFIKIFLNKKERERGNQTPRRVATPGQNFSLMDINLCLKGYC